MREAVSVVLTDFDGVLRHWPARYAARVERTVGLPRGAIQRAAFAPALLHSVVRGHISDADWRARIVKRLASAYPHLDAERAVTLWSESPGVVDQQVLGLIRACRARARLVLVSNATSRLESDLTRLHLTDDFDAIINSSEIGYAKPDPEVFHVALDAMGAEPSRVLFVDDSADNVAAAHQLGINAYRFENARQLRAVLGHNGLLQEH